MFSIGMAVIRENVIQRTDGSIFRSPQHDRFQYSLLREDTINWPHMAETETVEHTCKRFIASLVRPSLTGRRIRSLKSCQSSSGRARRNWKSENNSSTLFYD